MDEYRVYQAKDIPTVETGSLYLAMKLDRNGTLHCVGTGQSPEDIAANTYRGRLGNRAIDDQGREFYLLFSGA